MRFRSLAMAAAILVAAASPAAHAGADGGATASLETMTAEDSAALADVERYLNTVETMKARFIQSSANGNYAEGDLYLSRPGKMRLAYDPPVPILIVADGRFLIYYDSKLEQVSYLGIDSTPAGIILRPSVKLGGDVTVTGVKRGPGTIEVSLVQTAEPAAGELTLLLTDTPLTLRQWRVKDAQGQEITVSLFDARVGVSLDPKLFRFHDPNFFKQNAN